MPWAQEVSSSNLDAPTKHLSSVQLLKKTRRRYKYLMQDPRSGLYALLRFGEHTMTTNRRRQWSREQDAFESNLYNVARAVYAVRFLTSQMNKRITAADLKEQFDHNLRMRELVASASQTVVRVREAQTRLRGATGASNPVRSPTAAG